MSVIIDTDKILEMLQVSRAMFVAYCECLTFNGNEASDGFTQDLSPTLRDASFGLGMWQPILISIFYLLSVPQESL